MAETVTLKRVYETFFVINKNFTNAFKILLWFYALLFLSDKELLSTETWLNWLLLTSQQPVRLVYYRSSCKFCTFMILRIYKSRHTRLRAEHAIMKIENDSLLWNRNSITDKNAYHILDFFKNVPLPFALHNCWHVDLECTFPFNTK